MAQKNLFTITEALSFGWNTFKKNWQFLVIVTAIYLVVNIIPDLLNKATKDSLPGINYLINVLGWIASWVIEIGGLVIALKIIDHKVPKIEDLYTHTNLLFNYIVTNLMLGFIVIFGLIFFIVPGVYLALRFCFAINLVIDKKMSPVDSLKESTKLTEAIKLKLLGFSLATIAIIILGSLAFGIGALIAIPVTILADMYIYRKLSPAHHAQ